MPRPGRTTLLNDATAVLKEEGVDVHEGLEVRVVENTDKLFHLVLPLRRATGELSDEELESVAAGKCRLDHPCGRPIKGVSFH